MIRCERPLQHHPDGGDGEKCADVALLNTTCRLAFPDFQIHLDDRFGTDDRVVCRWRMSGTHQGAFYGIAPSGKRVEWAGISIWEFDDRKSRCGWAMQDVTALMAQLGVTGA